MGERVGNLHFSEQISLSEYLYQKFKTEMNNMIQNSNTDQYNSRHNKRSDKDKEIRDGDRNTNSCLDKWCS